jgi:hypothetical protein
MTIDEEILINKFGQELVGNEELLTHFDLLDWGGKRNFLIELQFLIIQSKPNVEYVDEAIRSSGLRSTYTPCVLLKKGTLPQVLSTIIALPENELGKAYILLLSLFKISYMKRFTLEKNNPNKWWYWDLSDEGKVLEVKAMHYRP